jgi:hypothetical protein
MTSIIISTYQSNLNISGGCYFYHDDITDTKFIQYLISKMIIIGDNDVVNEKWCEKKLKL